MQTVGPGGQNRIYKLILLQLESDFKAEVVRPISGWVLMLLRDLASASISFSAMNR